MCRISNVRREELINKGYLNKSEIREFIPCGYKKACQIYDEIREKNKAEGIENLSDVVLAKRVLPYIGMSAKEVSAAAKQERGA